MASSHASKTLRPWCGPPPCRSWARGCGRSSSRCWWPPRGDDFRLVRLRAAAALAGVPQEMIAAGGQPAVTKATDELLASFLARPDDSASYHNLGNFRLERHEYEAAIEAFTTAIRLQPRDISPLVNVSLAYNLTGQNPKAEASLRQALRLDPTNAAIHLNLGMLLAEMERPIEAEAAFRAAFNYDPRSAPAAFNLGVLLAKDRPEEALAWCRRAAELRPQESKYRLYAWRSINTARARPPRRRAPWKSSSSKPLPPPRPTRSWAGFTNNNASLTRPCPSIAGPPKTTNSPSRNALSLPMNSSPCRPADLEQRSIVIARQLDY